MGERKTVLVADDDDEVFDLAAASLSEDFRVLRARDGTQALAEARRELPDLILLDLDMPPRGGWAVLSELRRQPAIARLKVAIFSAYSLDGFRKMASELGTVGFVEKPFTVAQLLARVKELLASGS